MTEVHPIHLSNLPSPTVNLKFSGYKVKVEYVKARVRRVPLHHEERMQKLITINLREKGTPIDSSLRKVCILQGLGCISR